jgi:hypothetical protein
MQQAEMALQTQVEAGVREDLLAANLPAAPAGPAL